MSYSKLTKSVVAASTSNYTKGRNGYKICKITPHHMAGVLTGEQCARIFQNPNRQASSNYCIGNDGGIVCSVEEENRAWTSSSYSNDSQAITIEVSNSTMDGSWKVSNAAWNSLVELCVDICKRYNFKLTYDNTPNGSLTRHNMFANTNCPGPYLQSRFNELVNTVNAKLSGNSTIKPTTPSKPIPSTNKYKVGTKVRTNTLSTSSNGQKVYKGDWQGTITRVIPGTLYPYLLDTNLGWTNDIGIDTNPNLPSGTAPAKPIKNNNTLKVNDVVTLSTKATNYATGQAIPLNIKGKNYHIQQINGSKVLLKEIYSWVYAKDVTKVGGNSSKPVTTPAKKSAMTIAKEIINKPNFGGWGSGADRVNKLTQYGGASFAKEVQNIINRLL